MTTWIVCFVFHGLLLLRLFFHVTLPSSCNFSHSSTCQKIQTWSLNTLCLVIWKTEEIYNNWIYIYIYIWLSDKRSALCGVGVLTANKICFKHFVLLLHCVCVHNWSISQWKQYEFQIWSCWSNIYFWNWKAPWNLTPENRHNVCSRWVLSMLSFSYMTNQNITSVTDLYRGNIALYSAYKIVCH